jgi:hypothetical protein
VREQKFCKDWNSAEQVRKDKEPLRKSGLLDAELCHAGKARAATTQVFLSLFAVTRLKLESYILVYISIA